MKFTCDGCWMMATARARLTDGDATGWYKVYHREAHAEQKLAEVKYDKVGA